MYLLAVVINNKDVEIPYLVNSRGSHCFLQVELKAIMSIVQVSYPHYPALPAPRTA